jgi:hypothetical protein
MKYFRVLALCGTLLLTVGGSINVDAHALRTANPFLTRQLLKEQEQRAILIAKIRDVRSFVIKDHLTGLEQTVITERSLALAPHTFFVRTGRIRLIQEAILKRDEERARIADEIALRERF